jgi:hypothetical protein
MVLITSFTIVPDIFITLPFSRQPGIYEYERLLKVPTELHGKPAASGAYGGALGKLVAHDLQLPALTAEMNTAWVEYFVPSVASNE